MFCFTTSTRLTRKQSRGEGGERGAGSPSRRSPCTTCVNVSGSVGFSAMLIYLWGPCQLPGWPQELFRRRGPACFPASIRNSTMIASCAGLHNGIIMCLALFVPSRVYLLVGAQPASRMAAGTLPKKGPGLLPCVHPELHNDCFMSLADFADWYLSE